VERSSRVLQGYDQVPRWLARELGASLRLGAAVAEIAWEPGAVELTLRSASRAPSVTGRLAARAAVVTLPLGVLKAPPDEPGGLRWRPDPPRVRAQLGRLAMGSVVRLSVWFRELPWAHLPGLDRLSFLHTPGAGGAGGAGARRGPFNVWWSAYPLLAPLAVAWSGGPPAAALSRLPPAEIEGAALGALAAQLGIARRRVASRVEATWMHDWQGDPFARGAYSYARVGGAGAARSLSRPVDRTLFFAGEATNPEAGTVEGAIQSGLRAARQVARALEREG
jgi:monoamine oxidase